MFTFTVKDETGKELMNKNCHILSAFWMEDETVYKYTFDDTATSSEQKANGILGLNTLMCQEAAMYGRTLLEAITQTTSDKN